MGMRLNTAAFSQRISAMLTDLGVKHRVLKHQDSDDYITVDRTSMMQGMVGVMADVDEGATYDIWLARIQAACGPTAYVMWSGRTDDYLGVEVYLRDPS